MSPLHFFFTFFLFNFILCVLAGEGDVVLVGEVVRVERFDGPLGFLLL